jgi:hypothetical protein
VDVGGFAEPRKILCQCTLPSYEQISVHPRSAQGEPEFPNIGYLQPYLSACHAPVDAATFRSQVPLSSYDDYFHLINQLANGDIDHHQPLLSADPLLCFFYRYSFDFFFKPNSKKKKKIEEEKKKPILYQIIIYVLILLLWYQYNEAYLVSDYNLYFNFVALALVQ